MAKASPHDLSSFKMIATLLPPQNSCWQVYNLDLGCHLSHGLKGEEFHAVQPELHLKEGWPKHPRNSVKINLISGLFFCSEKELHHVSTEGCLPGRVMSHL